MIQSPDRAQCKKKWAVNKVDGPTTLFAEYVLKKLRHHFIPCRYELTSDDLAIFSADKYRPPLSEEFPNHLELAVRNVNADRRIDGATYGGYAVHLLGPHYVDERGNLKKGNAPMKINSKGLQIIKEFEGLHLKSYPDVGYGWDRATIGYGHTSAAGSPLVVQGMTISEQEAERILSADLRKFERAVNKLVTAPLTSNQFSALVSLVFNIGPEAFKASTLLKKLNAHDYKGAAYEFHRWNKSGGKVLMGLIRRRNAETSLFSAK